MGNFLDEKTLRRDSFRKRRTARKMEYKKIIARTRKKLDKVQKALDKIEPESDEHDRFDMLLKHLESYAKEDVGSEKVTMILVRLFGFLAAISNATSAKSAIVIATGICTQHVSEKHIHMITSVLEPEAGINFKANFQRWRFLVASFETMPCKVMVEKMLLIVAASGIVPDNFYADNAFFASLFGRWEEYKKSCGTIQLIDAIFYIGDFILDFMSAIENGISIMDVLCPTSLHNKYAQAMSDYQLLIRGDLKDKTIHTLTEEVRMLCKDLEKMMNKRKLSPSLQTTYTVYLSKISTLYSDLQVMDSNNQVRSAPFAFHVYGKSGVGKSSILGQLLKAVSTSCEIPNSPNNFYIEQENDRYDSGMNHDAKIYVNDDIGQDARENSNGSNAFETLISIINNMPCPTQQAELELKGKIYWKIDLVGVTSNSENMGVKKKILTDPTALYRRLVHIEAKVKPQFADSNGRLIRNATTDKDGNMKDCWLVRRYEMIEKRPSSAKNNNVAISWIKSYIDKEFISLKDMIPKIVLMAKRHYNEQTGFVDSYNKMREQVHCNKCGNPSHWCTCAPSDSLIVGNMENIVPEGFSLARIHPILVMTSHRWFNYCLWFSNMFGVSINCFPLVEYLVLIFEKLMFLVFSNLIISLYRGVTKWHGCKLLCLLILSISPVVLLYERKLYILSYVIMVLYFYLLMRNMKKMVFMCISKDIDYRIRHGLSSIRIGVPGTFIAAVGALASIKMIFDVTKELYSVIQPESQIEPINMDEVEERKNEKNPWIQVECSKLPADHKLETMTLDQVQNVVLNNLVRFQLDYETKRTFGSALFLNNCNVIIPKHSISIPNWWKSVNIPVTFFRSKDTTRSSFSTYLISPVEIPDEDWIIFTPARRPSFSNILHMFPFEDFKFPQVAHLIVKKKNGSLIEQDVYMTPMPTMNNGVVTAHGSKHMLSIPTDKGDCGSPYITKVHPHYIIGLHCGGNHSGCGASFSLSRSKLEQAIMSRETEMQTDEGVLNNITGVICEVDISGNGISPIKIEPEPHFRSCVRFLMEDDPMPLVDYYGTDKHHRVSSFSNVKTTPLSKHLEDLGNVCKWDKPQFAIDRNFSEYFQKATKGMRDIEPSILKVATMDYVKPIIDKMKIIQYPNKQPLTMFSAINGISGNRYINAMNLKTAPGHGYKGKKIDYFIPTTHDDGKITYMPNVVILQEVLNMMEKLKKGIMICPIVKPSLKDEPALKPEFNANKKKVRIFSVHPLPHLIVGRILLMPILEFMYSFPILSEQGQGLNCTTDEWEQLYKHVCAFSPDRILEGDYSKYDTKLSGQLIRQVGIVLATIAFHLGYEEPEIVAIKTYVCDLATSFWIYNGDLICLDGWNTSGNILTTIINGVANCLLHRSAFFSHECSMAIPFRDMVHMSFVGDDSLGSTIVNWFNMRYFSEWCSKHNIDYTSSDKNRIDVPLFVESEYCTFVQRSFRYEPRIDQIVAPLNINSIYKSLHMYHSGSHIDIETHMIAQVKQALRELARHSDYDYDDNLDIIRTACINMGIHHFLPELNWSKDDWWSEMTK